MPTAEDHIKQKKNRKSRQPVIIEGEHYEEKKEKVLDPAHDKEKKKMKKEKVSDPAQDKEKKKKKSQASKDETKTSGAQENIKKKQKNEKSISGGAQDNMRKGIAGDAQNNNGSNVINDPRFSSVHFDPRFQQVPRHQSKVAIDSRFSRMFSDKSFSSSSRLDKRGKPKKGEAENPLLHYYHHELEEEQNFEKGLLQEGRSDFPSDSESCEFEKLVEERVDESESETSSTSSEGDAEFSSEEDVQSEKEDVPLIEQETRRLAIVNMDWNHVKAVDLYVLLSSFLPKGGQILSVSVYPSEFGIQRMEYEAVHGPADLFDSDKDNTDDDDDDDKEIDNEKLRAYEKSRLRYYFAVVECDSNATADHLYKTCDGVEFERTSNVLDLRFIPDSMEFKHPPRDTATEVPSTYVGLDFHTLALQQSKIQLSWDEDEPERKKIMKRRFDSKQLDELEFKEFLASEDGSDEDDEREDGEVLPLDGKSKKPDKRELYRALVQSGDGSDGYNSEDQDMEVTFNTGLEDISKKILEKKGKKAETVWETYLRKRSEKKKARRKGSKFSLDDESSDFDEVPDQPDADDFFIEETSDTDEKDNIRSSKKDLPKKTKSKKNQKDGKEALDADKEQEASRAELELLLADDQGDDRGMKGYNIKAKKGRGKRGKEMPAEDKLPTMEYDDPRFSALFTSPLFALDPTDPQFKRSVTYARQLLQKQQKDRGEGTGGKQEKMPPGEAQLPSDNPLSEKEDLDLNNDNVSSKKQKLELSSLVRSVKRKVGSLQS